MSTPVSVGDSAAKLSRPLLFPLPYSRMMVAAPFSASPWAIWAPIRRPRATNQWPNPHSLPFVVGQNGFPVPRRHEHYLLTDAASSAALVTPVATWGRATYAESPRRATRPNVILGNFEIEDRLKSRLRDSVG